jgi:hypothetical protein
MAVCINLHALDLTEPLSNIKKSRLTGSSSSRNMYMSAMKGRSTLGKIRGAKKSSGASHHGPSPAYTNTAGMQLDTRCSSVSYPRFQVSVALPSMLPLP